MHPPPRDPGTEPRVERATWRGVLSGFLLVGGLLLLGLLASDPALGVVVLAVVLGAGAVTRRASGLARCLRHCGEFSYEVGDDLRITVSRGRPGDAA